MSVPANAAARWVIDQYPIAPLCREIVSLGNRGGFSGAKLWRVETAAGSFCLRVWPEGSTTPQRLIPIHDLMRLARQQGLSFVPAVLDSLRQQPCIEQAGRCWDLTEWMPGNADFHNNPSSERLRAACVALAELHQAWARKAKGASSCPALSRRMDRLREWQDLLDRGWRPDISLHHRRLATHAAQAWELLGQQLPRLPEQLCAWQKQTVPLQPCLCDIWHDHVLFEENRVTGIVDYGSVKLDHIAVDLARLLGSLIGDDEEKWQIGLRAYRHVRPVSQQEEDLARLLDRTGTLLALVNWLTWLYHERRHFENLDLVEDRLGKIVQRVERW